jgi:hypothetical protein
MNPSDKYEQIKDIKRLNPVELEAMVLHHEQQIKDIAAHLLELKQRVTPMMEFKPEKSLQEPVAWMYDQATYYEGDLRGRCWIPTLSRQDPKYPAMTRNVVALFAAPKEVD